MKTKENNKNILIIFIFIIVLILCIIYYICINKKEVNTTSELNIDNIKISNASTIDIEKMISKNTKEKTREEIVIEETYKWVK